MGRCAARPAVRGAEAHPHSPRLQSSSEAAARREGRDSSPRASRRACPTSAGTRCDGRRRLPLQPLLQRPSLPVHGLDPIPQRVVPSGGAAREAAAGTLGSISGVPQLLRPKARIRRPFVASILRVLAPAEGLRPRSPTSCTVFGFWLFARVGVYRRFVNGTASATRAPCGQSP